MNRFLNHYLHDASGRYGIDWKQQEAWQSNPAVEA